MRAPYWWRSHRRGDVFVPLAIGLVFGAPGRIGHAPVLLARDCSGVCVPGHHVGQVLTITYSSENVRYAQLYSRVARPSAGFLYIFLMLGAIAVIFLGAAVFNMFTA